MIDDRKGAVAASTARPVKEDESAAKAKTIERRREFGGELDANEEVLRLMRAL